MAQSQSIWMTVETGAAVAAIERLRELCEALPEDNEEKLREFGSLIDSTFKYLVLFQQRAPGQIANPVHFAAELIPTQRFEELLTFLEHKDMEGAVELLTKLHQVANKHAPAGGGQ